MITENDPKTVAILQDLSRTSACRTLKEHDDKGNPVFMDGYLIDSAGNYQFVDELGQHNIVTPTRVNAALAAAAPKADVKAASK